MVETTRIDFTIEETEVANSGIDASAYVFGVARRRAKNNGKVPSMVEYRFDTDVKKYRVMVYLKAIANA